MQGIIANRYRVNKNSSDEMKRQTYIMTKDRYDGFLFKNGRELRFIEFDGKHLQSESRLCSNCPKHEGYDRVAPHTFQFVTMTIATDTEAGVRMQVSSHFLVDSPTLVESKTHKSMKYMIEHDQELRTSLTKAALTHINETDMNHN
jgi:hypothetical protein